MRKIGELVNGEAVYFDRLRFYIEKDCKWLVEASQEEILKYNDQLLRSYLDKLKTDELRGVVRKFNSAYDKNSCTD